MRRPASAGRGKKERGRTPSLQNPPLTVPRPQKCNQALLALVRNLHRHTVEGHGIAGVQLLAACFLNVAVDLYQAVLNDLACLRTVLYEVSELEELAEANHVVANKNFFHAS